MGMKAGVKCPQCGTSRTDLVLGQFEGLCPGCLAGFAQTEAPATATTAGGISSRLGKFTLSEQLGIGASGEVWKAWDTVLRRWVALKIFHAINPEDMARISREAETSAKLSHPNIAAIYEVGEENGRHFLAMQYVPGQTLAKFPRRDIRLLARLIRDAARAVGAAHATGIVHRDLKPANLAVVRLPKERAGFHVYVLDFGLARPVRGGSTVTATGIVVGTPAYMSPEQARGEEVDGRADVYSLGTTLYELLTGKPPFRGPNVYEVLRKVQEREPKKPRTLDSKIPRDLETVVLKCLQKRPADRYGTAEELARDLDRWLEGDAILARRPSTAYRLQRALGKRKPLLVAAAAGILLAAGISSYHFMTRGAEARARERSQPHLEAGRRIIDSMKARIREPNHTPDEIRKLAGRAQGEFEAALAQFGKSPEPHMGMATAWRVANDPKKALAALERVIAVSPEYAGAYLDRVRLRLGDYAARRIPAGQEPSPETADSAALKSSLKSDLDAVRKHSRDEAEQLHARGLAAFIDGDYEEAQKLLSQFLAQSPGSSDAHVWRIRALHRLGRMDEVEKACTAAIEWDARNEMAHLFRGLVWQHRGVWERAVQDYGVVLKASPSKEAHALRGNARRSIRDFDGAIKDLDEALKLPRPTAVLHVWRAEALTAKGEFEKAMADFAAALTIEPRRRCTFCSRGRSFLAQGKTDEALSDFEEALKIDPKHSEALHLRGHARKAKGDLPGAILDYSEAVKQEPNSFDILLSRARALEKTGDAVEAAADLEAALKIEPTTRCGYCQRGNLLKTRGRAEEAYRDFTEALKFDPAHSEAYNNRGTISKEKGDKDAALRDFEAAIKCDPRNTAPLVNRGNLLADARDFAGAKADYDAALRINPRFALARVNRGGTFLEQGKYEDAIADFTEAIKVDPKYLKAYLGRGRAYLKCAKSALALADFQSANSLRPDSSEILSLIGSARDAMGNSEEALESLNEAVASNPQDAKAHVARGNLWMARGEIEKAIEDFDKAIELDPDAAGSYCNRGKAYHEKKDYDRAMQDFLRAIMLDPRDPDAHYNLGLQYQNKKNFDSAIAYYDKAVELGLKSALVHYNRGIARSTKGLSEEALADFAQALHYDPTLKCAYCHRGSILSAKGRWNESVWEFNSALKLDKNHAEAYYRRGLVLWAKGETVRALEDLDRALFFESDNLSALVHRSVLRERMKDSKGSQDDLNAALRKHSNGAWVYLQRAQARQDYDDLDGAIADYTEALRLDPNYADAYNDRASAKRAKGLLKEAEADCDEAIKRSDSIPLYYYCRAGVRRRLSNLRGERTDLDKAIELNPAYVNALYDRGVSKLIAGDPAGAAEDCTAVLRIDPNDLRTRVNRGVAYYRSRRLQEAKEDFDQVIRTTGRENFAFFNRGLVLQALGELKAAVDDYDAALNLDPGNVSIYKARGWARYDMGAWSEALEDFREGCRLGLHGYDADYARFAIWILQSRFEDKEAAMRDLKKYSESRAVGKGSDWPGQVLKFLRGDLAEAALLKSAAAEDAAEKVTDHSCEAYFYAGIKHLIEGDKVKAREYLKKAILTQAVAYWACDGNANDSSPADNDLVLNGGLGFALGKFGQALNFTDNEGVFAGRPGDDPEYDFGTGSFTIQFWVNFISLQGGQTLIEKRNAATGFGWSLSKFGSTSLQFSAEPGFSVTTGTISIATRVWHHVVMRRSGNLIQMFFDGEPSSTISNFAPISNTTAPLLVGKRDSPTGGDFPVNGQIDEIAIWNAALTNDEIAFLYSNGAGNPVTADYTPPPPPSSPPPPEPPPVTEFKSSDNASAESRDTTLPCAAGTPAAPWGLLFLACGIAITAAFPKGRR
jgi:tetratricopeptide (TPR) repeat protein